MHVFFAPLEGITGWVFRSVHHAMFPGLDAYYTPFSSPTADSPLTGRGRNDVLPEHNRGVPVIPQLLTNKAPDFIAAANILANMGYTEVNLNLGCPSGTVVSKKKGAGFLAQRAEVDHFLEEIFSGLSMKVSVKTRLGMHDPEEWPALLEIFNKYPMTRLIVHPRIREDFYREPVRMDWFRYTAAHTDLPLCYNGDLSSPADCNKIREGYPGLESLMAGRGLVRDPAMIRAWQGGEPLSAEEFRAFHDRLLEAYAQVLYGDQPVLGKLKELWAHWSLNFDHPEKYVKAMRKARHLDQYRTAVDALLRDRELVVPARPDHL